MSLIELSNVSRIYELGETSIQALADINLDIEQQTFVSFVGPSGSGKTTLLNLIGCLDKPSNGEIKVNNVRVNEFNRKDAAVFRILTCCLY
jgi:putative ABC transport system ATP-binding protein